MSDLFTAAELPAAVAPPPPDFRLSFLAHLAKNESATASFVRVLHKIPGDNNVGGDVRGLFRAGLIVPSGIDIATGVSGKRRLTRRWSITVAGRAALSESEARP